ncbi:T6SS phospholipase effector Tle1-like catalytic domain-containing protein [Arthrobacter sp. SAFR-044]|uniref:T6SS phospholipase effector Tle1-like catalytic domain-containing protein n=1 Tax=Arthrobacter sp. SAFR-044 TaxID=3387278 RepID=UPI003F7B3DF9
MSRNLVLCLDGTGAQLRAKGNTNVVLLYKMLDHSDPAKQIAYYDPGVGTFASAGAWTPLARGISRLGGLAFGWGLRQNLAEAYTWLMQNWAPGDQVFIFGFSRGAYTARALVGILRTVGMLRPGSENLVPYVIATYARRGGEDKIDWDEVHYTSEVFARQVGGKSTVPVKYLGLWDTVKAAGFLRWEITWPFTRELPNAARIRHAVSIHEKRAPFKEYLADARTDGSVEEVWFAGVHSDVGGTFDDEPGPGPSHRLHKETPSPRLSTIPLKWIVEGGIANGLLVRSRAAEATCSVTAADASAKLHRRGWAWVFLGTRSRKVPAGASVHESVNARALADPRFKAPANVVWVDPHWAGHPAVPASAGPQQ